MIDYNELREAIRNMKPRQRFFEILKEELTKQGRWKNKARGNPMRNGDDPRRSP